MIVYDGYTYKLEGLSSVVHGDGVQTYLSADDSICVGFSPHILHFDNKLCDYGVEIGKLAGSITLKNEDVVALENFKAFIAYNGRVM